MFQIRTLEVILNDIFKYKETSLQRTFFTADTSLQRQNDSQTLIAKPPCSGHFIADTSL